MRNIGVNFLVKIPIHYWDINKKRQGITFFGAPCRWPVCDSWDWRRSD